MSTTIRELPDFRGHTCGECAWAAIWPIDKEKFTCRRTGWMNSETGDGYGISLPACPGFVLRVETKEIEK